MGKGRGVNILWKEATTPSSREYLSEELECEEKKETELDSYESPIGKCL